MPEGARGAGPALRRLLGTALGLGWLPKAPGTWGSLGTALALALVLGVEDLFPGLIGGLTEPPGASVVVLGLGLLVAALTLAGVVVGAWAETDYGCKDPGSFVLDEVVGQAIPVLGLLMSAQPEVAGGLAPLPAGGLALAFAAFRVFDILKPPPVRQVERLPGGVGIMADDVVAGLYALLIVVAVA